MHAARRKGRSRLSARRTLLVADIYIYIVEKVVIPRQVLGR